MEKIGDYEILQKLDETSTFVVYRCRKDDYHTTVLIKLFKTKNPSSPEIAGFRQAYAAVAEAQVPGIAALHDIYRREN